MVIVKIEKLTFLIVLLVLLGVVFSYFAKKEYNSIFVENTAKEKKTYEEMLGSNFVVGFDGIAIDEKTREIIKYIKPAGIILYARNCKNGEQLKELINDLQKIAKETSEYKYFIMIDEEPGGATRIGAFDDVFDSGEPNWTKINSNIGVMSNIGINVNLAPVCDYPFNGDSFIKRRISANSVEDLISFNEKFIEISERNNVSTVLKHFPGMGFFTTDPHKKIPISSVKADIFNKSLNIFENGINNGSNFVMIDHAVYTDIDENIATLSPKIIKDILINQLGFKGIIITDDMSDMPILVGKKMEIDEATIDAIEAGNNMVMFSHRPESTKKIFDMVLKKGAENDAFKVVIKQNYEKIANFKKNHAIYSF